MNNTLVSHLYDQNTFYDAFLKDLRQAKSLVIIESPFITKKRMQVISSILRKLRARNVHIIVNTKPFDEHESVFKEQVIWAIGVMQDMGIDILFTSGHHRKLAVIDDILWEGSLNILSQNDSCEIMRRIKSKNAVKEMTRYTGMNKWL